MKIINQSVVNKSKLDKYGYISKRGTGLGASITYLGNKDVPFRG